MTSVTRRIVRSIGIVAVGLAGLAHAGDLVLRASLKYDALCLVGMLTGDPFYVRFYPQEYERFAALMTPGEARAFAGIKRIVKDEGKGLVAPLLVLYLSASDAETLDEMIDVVRRPAALEAALRKTIYWDEAEWNASFVPVRDDLLVALNFLSRIDFAAIWRTEYAPAIARRIEEIEAKLGAPNILDLQEKLLGFRPFAGPITAYLVHFSKPHGIRIVGARYITAYDYPLEIILSNAVHEPMHPPFRKDDPGFWQAVAPLRRDADLMDRVLHHDPAYGYNSFEGVVEEDSVQALEQVINERLGVAKPAGARFRDSDGGLHILAAALYVLLKRDGYDARGGNFQAWLVAPRTMQRLSGHVKELAETIVGAGFVKPMAPAASK